MAVVFPSREFFEALGAEMRTREERFRQLGYFDTTFGVRVRDPRLPEGRVDFVLAFEVFECVGVRESSDVLREPVDFVLDGDLAVWAEMLHNIRARGAADVAHTINTLTHFGDRLRVVYEDPDGHDKLYRFAESIQEFFDLAAQLEVEIAPRVFAGQGSA